MYIPGISPPSHLDMSMPVAATPSPAPRPPLDGTFVVQSPADGLTRPAPPAARPAPPPLEASLLEGPLPDEIPPEEPLRFEVVQGGSERGRDIVVDNRGHSYVKKKSSPSFTYWRCSVKSAKVYCSATVSQRETGFTPGRHNHICEPQPGKNRQVRMAKELKQKAAWREHVFTSSAQMVEVAVAELQQAEPVAPIPVPANMQRRVNRFREKTRPKHPLDLHFDLDTQNTPAGFLVKDVIVTNQRHLVFATEQQLGLLARAVNWYVDGTFRVVKAPFAQLFSVHAFIRKENSMKQVSVYYYNRYIHTLVVIYI